jgi:serpin B
MTSSPLPPSAPVVTLSPRPSDPLALGRRPRRWPGLAPALGLALAACAGPEPVAPRPAPGSPPVASAAPPAATAAAPPGATAAPAPPLAEAVNPFAADLYGRLRAAEGNFLFSPVSIEAALAVARAGARGETARQMSAVLRLPEAAGERMFAGWLAEVAAAGAGGGGPELRVASRLWAQADLPFRPTFLTLARDAFGAPVGQVDFRQSPEPARQAVNAWVAEQTARKIVDLLPPGAVTPRTRLVVANAVYFRGQWAAPFAKGLTKPGPFYAGGRAAHDVPLMHGTPHAAYGSAGDADVVELAYASPPGRGAGPDLALTVVLPKARDGLGAVEARLVREGAAPFLAALGPPQPVRVALPRFRAAGDFDLGRALAAMGMPLAFEEQADFGGIAGERLALTKVVHKAFIDVNEEGTEAAAATGVVVGVTSAPATPPPEFRADHPFLFLLRDRRSGLIYFAGRLADPG